MIDNDLMKRLDNLWAMLEEDGHYVKANTVSLAKEHIEYLEKKLKLLEKTDMYLKTNYPDKTGYYFICGEGGTKDDNGLPERLHVCPAYGADWMMVYTRTDKTSGPEY
jgi:hypothetical protein